jgi:hypothetical protein
MCFEGRRRLTETCRNSLCPGKDSTWALNTLLQVYNVTNTPICLVSSKHFLLMLSFVWVKAQEIFWSFAQFNFRLAEGVTYSVGLSNKVTDILKAFYSFCQVLIYCKICFVFGLKIVSVVEA